MKMFGAFGDELIVGMVGLRRMQGPKEGHKAFIWGMYVTPRSRSGGAGSQLLRAAIDEARTWSGVQQIQLSVSSEASDARRLYERHGFRAWGCEPRAVHWAGAYTDEIHMILDLRAGIKPAATSLVQDGPVAAGFMPARFVAKPNGLASFDSDPPRSHCGNHSGLIGDAFTGNIKRGSVIGRRPHVRKTQSHIRRLAVRDQFHRDQALIVIRRDHHITAAAVGPIIQTIR